MLRFLIPLISLVMLASTASAGTLWLRGQGDDVWMEKDGRYVPSREDRKGLTVLGKPIRAAKPTPPEPRDYRLRDYRYETHLVVYGSPYRYYPSYFHGYPSHRWHKPYLYGHRYHGHRIGHGGHYRPHTTPLFPRRGHRGRH